MFSNTGVSFLIPCEDPKVRDLFDKIAKYRKMWSLQLHTWSDWGDDFDAQDDDQYTQYANAGIPIVLHLSLPLRDMCLERLEPHHSMRR